MMRRNRSILMVAVFALVVACHYTYTGTYSLDSADSLTPSRVNEIGVDMSDVLSDFGFIRDNVPDGVPIVAFSKRGRATDLALAELEGSNATITVAIRFDRPVITVRDLTYSTETEFLEALKDRIETFLQTQDVETPIFDRQSDLLFR